MTVPVGLTVRLRPDVERRDGGRLLVGGSPVRAVRLSAAAHAILHDGAITVHDEPSWLLARRLLDGNLADPAPGPPAAPADLTVVIPVRDRADQLTRCLKALGDRVAVIVVDDASADPVGSRRLAESFGAQWIGLGLNRGPAAARNVGLGAVTTRYVAFIDSDVTVSGDTLLALAGHFVDPRVALVGPLVQGQTRSPRPRWFERYDAAASSLALGRRPCSVRPGAAVGWLPSAALVGRVSALVRAGGFSEEMRVGEDVDLVWRLVGAGHVVRYEPGHVARHDVRSTVRGWLGRKVVYGSGAAALEDRHGDAVAPAVLSPLMACAGALLLTRSRRLAPLAVLPVAAAAVSVARTLPPTPGRGGLAARLAVRGLGWSLRQESALLLRHWWPATIVGLASSRVVRQMVLSALIVDAVVMTTLERPAIDPVTALAGRRLDDLAYGAGVWLGAMRARDLRCLAVRVTH